MPFVDHIIVVSNGQISEEGSYDALLSHDGAFANFLKEYFQKKVETEADPESMYSNVKTSCVQYILFVRGQFLKFFFFFFFCYNFIVVLRTKIFLFIYFFFSI